MWYISGAYENIDYNKRISCVVMFDGSLNVQIGGYLLKINYIKLTVMHGVKQTVSLFFNDVFKIPTEKK